MTKRRIAARIVAWTVVGLVGVTGVAVAAQNHSTAASATQPFGASPSDSPSDSPSASPSDKPPGGPAAGGSGQAPAAKAGGRGRAGELRRLARRTVHSSAVVQTKDGTFHTVDTIRGETQTGTSATSIVVKAADGVSETYVVTSDTRIRIIGGPRGMRHRGSAGDLASGEQVVVIGSKDGGSEIARIVLILTPTTGGRTGG